MGARISVSAAGNGFQGGGGSARVTATGLASGCHILMQQRGWECGAISCKGACPSAAAQGSSLEK